jgi:hypothetical protein
MRVWTVHTRDASRPVLVPERFTWAGLLFGPFWLLSRGAWLAGLIALAADFAILFAKIGPAGTVLGFGTAWLIGLFGNDLRRWSLDRRGYRLTEVVAEQDQDAALARLLTRRPELLQSALV